jgi:hypothetical protein
VQSPYNEHKTRITDAFHLSPVPSPSLHTGTKASMYPTHKLKILFSHYIISIRHLNSVQCEDGVGIPVTL